MARSSPWVITSTPEDLQQTSPTVTSPPGAARNTAPNPSLAITTMWRQEQRDTSTTSEVPPGIQPKATTATTSASGTSSPSTAIARRSAVVMPPQHKSDG